MNYYLFHTEEAILKIEISPAELAYIVPRIAKGYALPLDTAQCVIERALCMLAGLRAEANTGDVLGEIKYLSQDETRDASTRGR